MIPYFPKQISYRAIIAYLVSLVLISLYYANYAMPLVFIVLGVLWVSAFFLLANSCTQNWFGFSDKRFIGLLFLIAFSLRVVWVIGSYYYYIDNTGTPFGYEM